MKNTFRPIQTVGQVGQVGQVGHHKENVRLRFSQPGLVTGETEAASQ